MWAIRNMAVWNVKFADRQSKSKRSNFNWIYSQHILCMCVSLLYCVRKWRPLYILHVIGVMVSKHKSWDDPEEGISRNVGLNFLKYCMKFRVCHGNCFFEIQSYGKAHFMSKHSDQQNTNDHDNLTTTLQLTTTLVKLSWSIFLASTFDAASRRLKCIIYCEICTQQVGNVYCPRLHHITSWENTH